jgi:hypothetical protein
MIKKSDPKVALLSIAAHARIHWAKNLKDIKYSEMIVVLIQAGATDLALPVRRRSGPLGGQEATRSERPWGLSTCPLTLTFCQVPLSQAH